MNEFIIKFKRPYTFEGKEYTEIDLSGIEELNATDLIQTQKMLSDKAIGTMVPELNYEYNFMLAAKATKLPMEFFYGLPGQAAVSVKTMVSQYFLAD